MKRREFCRNLTAVGGAVVLAPLIKACAPKADMPPTSEPRPTSAGQILADYTPTSLPTDTPQAQATATPDPTRSPEQTPTDEPEATATPRPTEEPVGAKIALVRTTDRAEGVRRALALLALNPVRGERVLLKPNFNSADDAPASTHPDVLHALASELLNNGARSIAIGERSGMGDTRAVLKQKGALELAARLGLDTLVFDELAEQDWVVRHSSDFHWSNGIAVPRGLLDSGCVVQTCNLKTHGYGGHFTMSLKNSVGFVARTVPNGGHNYMSELHGSGFQRHMIAEINTLYSPALILMDGVEAFVEGGPATGKIVRSEVVIAGTDRVAVDAVGVAILRLFGTTPEVSTGKIFEQAQIARAVELGLGVDSPSKVGFLTDDVESQTYASRIRDMLLM